MRPFSTRAADVATIAILIILILVAFGDIVVFHRALYVRDVARFFYPNLAALRELIRSGAFHFWTFRFNAGQPLAANPAFAALYPPQWIGDLQLEVVSHYLLAAIGMYVFLRSLRLRPLSALFGAASFALGGMLLSLSNLINVLFGVAWLPWLAFAGRRFFATRRPSDFALTSLILGVILIIGDQAVILQAGFLLIAFAKRRRQFTAAILIVVAALAAGSAQIVPALDHQRDSGRAGALPYAVAAQWTLPPARLFELAVPSLFGSFREWTFYWAGKRFYPQTNLPWVFSFYCGMLVCVLACAGFVRRVRGWTFTATVLVISYAASIVPLLYFAGLRSIRYPEKFFISGVFTLIVFAAITADQLLDDDRLQRAATTIALIVTIGATVSLIWVSPARFAEVWRLSGYFGDLLEQAHREAAITIATALVLTLILGARRFLSPPLWVAMLTLFVLADLAPRIRGFTPRIDSTYYDPPPVAQQLRGARIYNDADWRLTLLGSPPLPVERRAWRVRNGLFPEIQAIWGMDGVLEHDITMTNLLPSIEFSRIFLTALLSRRGDVVPILLTMAGTTHVAELLDPTSADRPIRIVALPSNQRFYFADQIVNGPMTQLFGGRFSRHVAFTDVRPFAPAAGRIVKALQQSNAIDLDVETNGDALLVIAVTRHKYWKGIMDGMPSPPHPANGAFQCFVVPPGKHHVALRYRNPLVMIFGFVSIVSAAALLIVAFVLRNREWRPQWPH